LKDALPEVPKLPTSDSEVTQVTKVRYGTFLGVFTPSVLTILGAIMFLRFGWVVGNAGLVHTLVIVALANVITMVTALSVSSLATSQRVGVGGAYYLVSRSLGLEMGGAIGLPLYLSQAVSITLYCFALGEALQFIWPGLHVQWVAAAFVVLVTWGASKSTKFALKAQGFILIAVGLSVVSLAMGADWGGEVVVPAANYISENTTGFWSTFAVFFPAVTGILTGLSLSGDLRDPERSLPLGTLSAVAVGFVIYLIVPLALSLHGDPEALRNDPLVWMKVAAFPVLILPGLITAILSSALGSVLAAPRTLQALSDDAVLPGFLGKLKDGEPKFATLVSGAVALAAVALGDLNAVATVVTLFFLTTYGMVNVVSTLETLVGNPSFRPRFHFHWLPSLAAAIACFLVMFLISPVASVVALVVEILIYIVLSRRALSTTWGDMRAGIQMALARWALLKHKEIEAHPRNWRPHILVFSSDVERDLTEIGLATKLSQGRGIVTVASLREGTLEDLGDPRVEAAENDAILRKHGLVAFCEVDVVPDLESGLVTVVQANGIAGMQSNTVLLRWPRTEAFPEAVARCMRRFDALDKSLLVVSMESEPQMRLRTIDVWWSGQEDNGDLMLLLAHLLSRSEGWRRTTIALKTIVQNEDEILGRRKALGAICDGTRIGAKVEVVLQQPGDSVQETIHAHSRKATMVFLGLGLPEEGKEAEFGRRLKDLVEGLGRVVLVRNSGPFRGKLIQVD
jgi:amino acid transporter